MTSEKRLFLSPPDVGARERDLLIEAFASGYVAPAGPMLERFEAAFSTYTGIPHAVALASGTAALHLSLHMLELGPGDAVIAPTLTFIGGVAPIVYKGATPIFVDCHPQTWCIDPKLLDEAFQLAERKGLKVRAIVPADLYGQACDIDEILLAGDRRGTPVIFDSAEAMGAIYKNRHAGQGGLAAAFSFNGNKIITTSGGGMLASTDKALIDRARYLSTAARQAQAHYEHEEVGFNYRLSNLSAAIGLGQLEAIEEKVRRRREIFSHYKRRLAHLPGLRFSEEAPNCRHTRWLTVVLVGRDFGRTREEIRLSLEHDNIECRPLWKPMHLQPVFAAAPRVGGRIAAALFEEGLCLPSGSAMTDGDIERVCCAVEACRRGAAT